MALSGGKDMQMSETDKLGEADPGITCPSMNAIHKNGKPRSLP